MFLNYLRNTSWKCEFPSLKNLWRNGFLVDIYIILEKIDKEKVVIQKIKAWESGNHISYNYDLLKTNLLLNLINSFGCNKNWNLL